MKPGISFRRAIVTAALTTMVNATTINHTNAAPGFLISRVADLSTTIPGRTETFVDFEPPVIGGGTVAFIGEADGFVSGVYASINGGSLLRIADETTMVPGFATTFTSFWDVALAHDGAIAFNAQFFGGTPAGDHGIYVFRDGTLTKMVDTTDIPPGATGPFRNFFDVSFDGNEVTFNAISTLGRNDFHQGVYASDGSSIRLIADESTLIPGGSGTFDDFGFDSAGAGSPTISFGNVVFTGGGPFGQSGVYAEIGGVLQRIVDQDSSKPGGGEFEPFDQYSANVAVISGNNILFSNSDPQGLGGVYVDVRRILYRVADHEYPVAGLFDEFSTPSIQGNRIAFGASTYEPCGIGCSKLVFDALYTNRSGTYVPVVRSGEIVDGKQVTAVTHSRHSMSNGSFAVLLSFRNRSFGIYYATPWRLL